MPDRKAGQATDRFVLRYALAWAGGTIAYTPLLTILLPVQVAGMAGKQVGVDWLAYIALAGAAAASLGGILFGLLSDLTGNRRVWVAAGMVLSCLMLQAVGQATTLTGLIAAVVCWQLALNMMLGPLAAWAGDVVPDGRKGLLGGLMAFAPGMGALAGAIVTQPGLADNHGRLVLVAALVAICVLPVLLFGAPQSLPDAPAAAPECQPPAGSPVVRMWLARLAIQVAEATLFAYLLFWLLTIDPASTDHGTARLFSLIMLVSAPLALAAGRWSDRANRPMLPLLGCAALSAAGLAAMAVADGLNAARAAYGLFGLASAVFLALHSAQTLRILPRPDRRGRDLGLFNLANTMPSLVMPWLAVALVPLVGFQGLFAMLAVLAAAAALLLVGIAGLGQGSGPGSAA